METSNYEGNGKAIDLNALALDAMKNPEIPLSPVLVQALTRNTRQNICCTLGEAESIEVWQLGTSKREFATAHLPATPEQYPDPVIYAFDGTMTRYYDGTNGAYLGTFLDRQTTTLGWNRRMGRPDR